MPVLAKILFLTATLWSAVYSLSYSFYCLKKGNLKGALASMLLTLLMLIISIISVFFRYS